MEAEGKEHRDASNLILYVNKQIVLCMDIRGLLQSIGT